jgi:hypothetical protein
VAQTRRKRKTKHRGTPAGNVVARGRTSRPSSRAQARQQVAQQRARARAERAAQPPSMRRAVWQAAVGACIFLVAMILFKQPLPAALMASGLMFFLYVPMSYQIDKFMHGRYKARLAREAAARQAEKERKKQ